MRLTGRSSEQDEVESYIHGAMPRLVGLAHAMTGNRADAEDLVQETLATVIARWARVSEAQHVDAYVRRTMVNTLISKKRKRASTEVISHEAVTADWSAPHAAGPSRAVVERDLVLAMLRRLPDRQRAVMALRYYEDLPDAEIAEALGCSHQAVRSAAHTAMTKLREMLPAYSAEEAGR